MGAIGNRRLFYGSIVVAGAFLSCAVSAGLIHSVTVCFVAILEEFAWSRADSGVAHSISQFIFALMGSYRLAFLLTIASYLGECVTFWFLHRPAKG